MTTAWHPSHTEDPPTIGSVRARWCTHCTRMILTDDEGVTEIGADPCSGPADTGVS